MFKDYLDKIQKSATAFMKLLNLFSVIRQFADQKLDENRKAIIKGLYVLAFTPEKMDQKTLMTVTQLADGMLRNKNSAFKRMLDAIDGKRDLVIHVSP